MNPLGEAAFAPAPESHWLIEQIKEFDDARLCGDEPRQRETFLQVVNRCAQLSRWAALHLPEHVTVPANTDPIWEGLAKR